jgi:hypothetical protein
LPFYNLKAHQMGAIQELKTNSHPADRLAETREQIKALKAKEKALRQELIASPQDRSGAEWVASITQKSSDRYDLPAIVRHFGTAALQQFKSSTSTTFVRLKRKG